MVYHMKNPQIFIFSLLIIFGLSACVLQTRPVENGEAAITKFHTQSLSSVNPSETTQLTLTPTKTSTPTLTPTPMPTSTPTITPTPYQLQTFTSDQIRSDVIIETYIENQCNYLEKRWGEGKSAPGTIVVPIMFHSIAKAGRVITDSTTISTSYFEYFMRKAKELGFATVTMDELVGFIENNEKIPERSMILIIDDRLPGSAELFMPYLIQNQWTLTLGWPTTDLTPENLWKRMEDLVASGYMNVQSHGHDHNVYHLDSASIKEIEEEIYKPIEIIQAHFGTTPSAIIWPGGNFNDLSVNMAREAGFKLGFTYSRGPLMYNWIPLGERNQ